MTDGRPVKDLQGELASRIAKEGPLRFRDFMELALYHPRWGYYTAAHRSPGRAGDFFTSVSVGALFGGLLADWVAAVWREGGFPTDFEILEQGAHHGRLARDLLDGLRADHPETYEALYCYHLVERAALGGPRSELLAPHRDKVAWARELPAADAERPSFRCFLANELLDAFPVHRVVWNGRDWRESYVTAGPRGFAWKDDTLSEATLATFLEEVDTMCFEPGYTTEVNLEIGPWACQLTAAIPRGRALLIDYGFEADTLYAPFRREGTLQAYAAHRRSGDLLAEPGRQDLTAHVNLTQVRAALAEHGWTCRHTTDHHRFLTALARPRLLAWEKDLAALQTPAGRQWLRQFQQLTHPGLMGHAFKVLEFERPPPPTPPRNPVEPPANLA